MATRALFFDAELVGDPAEPDRVYQLPDSFPPIFRTLVSGNGRFDGLAVVESAPTAMSVRVQPGRAFIDGFFFEVFDAAETLAVAAADPSQPRTDLVVVQLDRAGRDVRLEVVTGIPGAGVPALPADAVELARVAVAAGATQIVQANITAAATASYPRGQLVQPLVLTASTTFVKADYPWLRKVGYRILGAGGPGGGCQATAGNQTSAGDGGGAGAEAVGFVAASALAASEAVTVGASAAGVVGGSGSAGGSSSFAGVTATGGQPGGVFAASTAPGFGGGGAGGTATGGSVSNASGPRGGGAIHGGSSFNAARGGKGGDTRYGAGGNGGSVGGGGAGQGFGSGGGGASNPQSQGLAYGGGASAPGVVILYLYA